MEARHAVVDVSDETYSTPVAQVELSLHAGLTAAAAAKAAKAARTKVLNISLARLHQRIRYN